MACDSGKRAKKWPNQDSPRLHEIATCALLASGYFHWKSRRLLGFRPIVSPGKPSRFPINVLIMGRFCRKYSDNSPHESCANGYSKSQNVEAGRPRLLHPPDRLGVQQIGKTSAAQVPVRHRSERSRASRAKAPRTLGHLRVVVQRTTPVVARRSVDHCAASRQGASRRLDSTRPS